MHVLHVFYMLNMHEQILFPNPPHPSEKQIAPHVCGIKVTNLELRGARAYGTDGHDRRRMGETGATSCWDVQ